MTLFENNIAAKEAFLRYGVLFAAAATPVLLLIAPAFGLTLFWDVIIPLVPALLVIVPGLWRNVCPLAVAANLPSGWFRRKRRRPTPEYTAILNLAAVTVLLLIIPLRHALFDTDAAATAFLLTALTAAALLVGILLDGRGGWCAGLCPLYPVEKLYGSANPFTFHNGRCARCKHCTAPCPDTTRNTNPFPLKNRYHSLAGTLMIGGFPGFIWGWFQLPDGIEIVTIKDLYTLYAAPFTGLAITATAYEMLRRRLDSATLVRLFAAAAVASYYAFRIPNLLGFGRFARDGVLIDLSQTLPGWSVAAAVALEALFFFWWFLLHTPGTVRPWLAGPGKRMTR